MSVFYRFWLGIILGICIKASEGQEGARTIQLSNGNQIPIVGLGTYLLKPKQVDATITAALNNGYRHIDSAFVYNNEKDLGNTLKKWLDKGGQRRDLFIVSKLPTQATRPSDVAQAFELSLNNLGLDYIDMYLVHTPFSFQRTSDFQFAKHEDGSYIIDYTTDIIGVWKEMEKLVKTGKVKSIGLSNFNETQLLRIYESAEIKPTDLRIENHPYLQQDGLIGLARQLGVVVTAYNPFEFDDVNHQKPKREIVESPPLIKNPVVLSIAEKHKKSPAQVLLRFNIQRGLAVSVPKTTNPDRIKESIDVFDFELTEEDMNQLRSLDQHGKIRKYDFLHIKGITKHPEYPFLDRILQTRDN